MLLSANSSGVSFKLKLTPKAARNALVRIDRDVDNNGHLRASVTTVPEKGKANTALIKLLSKKLALPKTSIRLIAGELSRYKTVQIDGEPETLTNELKAKFRELGLMG